MVAKSNKAFDKLKLIEDYKYMSINQLKYKRQTESLKKTERDLSKLERKKYVS